ncbi:MAG: hypothetical protein FWC50_15025 [Planctomycetaceae bacterium]|nr:hypothetical protein [Planctomycetaceae bacterium]
MVFSSFDAGIAWYLEESEYGEGEIRQSGEALSESGSGQVVAVAVFVPPAVFDEVERVLDLPVITDEFLKVAWRHIRRVNICDEVTSIVREKRVRSVEYLTIHTQNDLTMSARASIRRMISPSFTSLGSGLCKRGGRQ